MLDSGGGREGMHLSLEFALLMVRNQIDVFALREYFTKALMPLDRTCHREMEAAWVRLRMQYSAKTGSTVSTPFQALALIREAYLHGTQEKHVKSSWRSTGIFPWDPDEIVVNQAAELFRARTRKEDVGDEYLGKDSKHVLKVPDTMIDRKVKCDGCGAQVLVRHRHCCECGHLNSSFDPAGNLVLKEGRRAGFKKMRPTQFDLERLVKEDFAGLRAVSETGKKLLADDSDSGSSSSSNEKADKEEAKPEPEGKPEPKYDPPTFVPAQLATVQGQRKAWQAVLSDVLDKKHGAAMIHWIPDFIKASKADIAKHFDKKATPEEIHKSLVDNVVKKTHSERAAWYKGRVALMMKDMESKSAKKIK